MTAGSLCGQDEDYNVHLVNRRGLVRFTHTGALQTWRRGKLLSHAVSLPGRRHRWVRRSSRWACRGRTASRSLGFHSREGLGQPPDLCATQRKRIGLRLLPLGLIVGAECRGNHPSLLSLCSMFRSRCSSDVTSWHLIFPSELFFFLVPTGIAFPFWWCLLFFSFYLNIWLLDWVLLWTNMKGAILKSINDNNSCVSVRLWLRCRSPWAMFSLQQL